MNKTPTYEIVQIILRRGNQPGLIREWFDGMKAWADANRGADAAALRTWLPLVIVRPFYTAEELARLWPALKLTLGLEKAMTPEPGPNRLSNELKFHGLPIVQGGRFSDQDRFTLPGQPGIHEFFIVEHCHKWRGQELSQEDFENVLFN